MGIEKNILLIIFCRKASMQNSISVGISFPKKIMEKIDEERGDISRSKYLLKIIEKVFLENVEKK